MTQVGRRFGLSERLGSGVCCNENGLFVGEIPLLECCGSNGFGQWRPRSVPDLSRDLSKRYGLPIELQTKIGGLAAVARALDRGDFLAAQIAALHLQLPDPPALAKSSLSKDQMFDLARQLKASGLLKADWDPQEHPRWPAGSADGIGGEFAPKDSAMGGPEADEPSARAMPVQLDIPILPELSIPRGIPLPRGVPVPRDIPTPREIPVPRDILPPPLAPPDISPIYIPRNPYPGRRRCVREWAEATEYCVNLWASDQMGRDYIRGMGKTIAECIMGRVSEDCGGSGLDA